MFRIHTHFLPDEATALLVGLRPLLAALPEPGIAFHDPIQRAAQTLYSEYILLYSDDAVTALVADFPWLAGPALQYDPTSIRIIPMTTPTNRHPRSHELPPPTSNGRRYPWDQMIPGDTFFVPDTPCSSPISAACAYRQRIRPQEHYAVRKFGTGVRVTRRR